MESSVKAELRAEELVSIVSNVGIAQGRSAVFTSNTGPHSASVQVDLSTADERKRSDREIIAALRPRFAGKFPGATYRFVPGGLVARTINFGSDTALEVEVLGYDLGAADALSRELARIMASTSGVTDVTTSRDANYPQVEITVDRENEAAAGLLRRRLAAAVPVYLNSD